MREEEDEGGGWREVREEEDEVGVYYFLSPWATY